MLTSTLTSTDGQDQNISLTKYHYHYLGQLEGDFDSFNRRAGLPDEVVETLRRLHLLAKNCSRPYHFLQSYLLKSFIEFLLKIPEGLIPSYFAQRLCIGLNDQAIRTHLKSLPLENYCALRLISFFIKSVCFPDQNGNTWIRFDLIDRDVKICEALTPLPRDDRFKQIIITIFKDPSKYFIIKQ